PLHSRRGRAQGIPEGPQRRCRGDVSARACHGGRHHRRRPRARRRPDRLFRTVVRCSFLAVITPQPVVLESHGGGIRLEPLREEHADALAAAASDGRLWELWFVAVPPPDGMRTYVADALKGQHDGDMLPWIVGDLERGGSARDVVMYSILATEWPDVRRHLELRLQRHDRNTSPRDHDE